ncbi:MAG: helix-turn-helix transcriptional regulator [Blautia sp.]|uniref:helix-turn-helix transcriptional regulator n=1 Tax=Blautia sp. TaxID=1955243 RepID=UPI002A74C340|nr:helix-turn-helix transcriptional regulator [Blautia sp.]MDY3017015.1 helix-turn-helix transcriptional regulator [Blautia sp.]
MSIDKLQYLGNCVRSARIACNLTQQSLADQCNVSIKTIRNIEKGKMNPSYDILFTIVNRLGLSANDLFNLTPSQPDKEVQQFIGKFNSCNSHNKKILINTLNFLAEQLLANQEKPHNGLETE